MPADSFEACDMQEVQRVLAVRLSSRDVTGHFPRGELLPLRQLFKLVVTCFRRLLTVQPADLSCLRSLSRRSIVRGPAGGCSARRALTSRRCKRRQQRFSAPRMMR
jgi:hypothetical protein